MTAITPSPSWLVNRRRPLPLFVPAVTTLKEQEQEQEAGPETQETVGHGFAAYCRKGKGQRWVHMEDRHVAAVGLRGDPHTAFFGGFDGHSGKATTEFTANNMPRIMAQELLQQQQQQTPMTTTKAVEEAMRRAYLRTDADFSSTSSAGGACCVMALLREGRLVVSNAVLYHAGKANQLTSDHRASREDERHQIESQGSFVVDCRGTWQVQGSLAVSRGIGDGHLKPWVLHRRPAAPSAACRWLVELVASRGSTDDITVLIVRLSAMSDDLYLCT